MNITTLKSLRQRIREATGPDRELDCLLRAVVRDGRAVREHQDFILARNPKPPHDEYVVGLLAPGSPRKFREADSKPGVPRYTASLDACVSLLSEVLPGCEWNRDRHGDFWIWRGRNRLGAQGRSMVDGANRLANDCLTFIDAIISAAIVQLEAKEAVG